MRQTLLLVMLFAVGCAQAQYTAAFSAEEWITVQVQISEPSTAAPVSEARCFLTIPGRPFTLASGVSDSAGQTIFLVKAPETGAEIIFTAFTPKGNRLSIHSVEPFTKPYRFPELAGGAKQADSLAFYGQPDKRYYLDEYTRFSTMEEIFIEYIPEVRIRKLRNSYAMAMLNAPYGSFFNDAPLVLLDGFPVMDLRDVMQLDPLSIRRMELVTRKYYFGSLICSGIISIETYTGKMSGYKLPEGVFVATYDKK